MAHAESDLQRALDAELSPPEAARLAAYLEIHPDARQTFENLKGVDAALHRLGQVDPPPELRHEVMRQIRLQAAVSGSSAGKSWIRAAWDGLRDTRPIFQLGLGFALGILVLLPAIWDAGQIPFNPEHVAGTLSRSQLALPKALAIEAPGVTGELLKAQAGSTLELELKLSSEDHIRAAIILGDPVSLVSWSSEPATGNALQFAASQLSIEHAGEVVYHIKVLGATDSWSPISLLISRDGQTLYQEAVP